MTLAAILDAERARIGVTNYAVAKRAGFAAGVTARIFDGRTTNPRLDTLLAILTALGRDLVWLGRRMRENSPATGD